MTNQPTRWTPQLTMMTDERIHYLHTSAVKILSDVGVNIHHPLMVELLVQAGAKTGPGNLVFIPDDLVSRSLESIPTEVVIHNRSGEPVLALGPHQVYFGTGSDLIYTRDHPDQGLRPSTLDDVGRSARLCEGLDEIDFVMSFGLPSDVPNQDAEPQQYQAIIRNTLKPVIMTSFSGLDALERMHEMACLVAGGEQAFREKPNYIMYGQFVSPLEHDFQALERLIFCADAQIPLIYIPTIMSGASGPITFLGSLALALSETLAGLVMHQLRSPGAPFITGACISPLDMKTGLFPYGSAEWRLNDLIMAEMARHYGLPVFGTGGATDSKTVDAQAGLEYSGSLLAAALAGTNLIHDVGYLNSGLTGSLESIVLGADIIRWVNRFREGVEINQDTLGLDLIQEVGPAGEFLSHDHTYQHLHDTVWTPLAIDHQDHDSWEEDGSRDYAHRALDFAQETISKTDVPPLPPEIDRKLSKLSRYSNGKHKD